MIRRPSNAGQAITSSSMPDPLGLVTRRSCSASKEPQPTLLRLFPWGQLRCCFRGHRGYRDCCRSANTLNTNSREPIAFQALDGGTTRERLRSQLRLLLHNRELFRLSFVRSWARREDFSIYSISSRDCPCPINEGVLPPMDPLDRTGNDDLR